MCKRFLGVDTSNYRTSAAIFESDTLCWVNEGELLTVPAGAIGLRQSDALFQHTVRLHEKIGALPIGPVCAVGVSTRPRAVEGSYMPCFLAGESAARSAAHLLSVPLFPCSHQQGHIAAAALSAGRLALLDVPFLAWHLSGGTTELLLVRPGEDGLPDCACIGGTTDLSAGQLVDRAGAALGLSFPSGAALDRHALDAAPEKGAKPRVTDGYFSLSGMQNQVESRVRKKEPPAQIARFTLETVANAVWEATRQARRQYPYPVLCAGGVMASGILRARFAEQENIFFAEPRLSGDNAVGVAVLAARQYERTEN
ncbi:DNA-binding protein [Agathobaculum sp. NTUH-O15-33]|uniref:DNA-binding protein n=1 Tax=Agathobaculum sp. NTUH-O15-33 TaxID=3079302 RepID=UPI00295835DC|nr:DNA-binding protein [Agathobaculum sp. NTUH-O15-33]WNX83065.1 DNA-binding protein [Agathobaculum sp. NTUH-O15-33]